MFYVLPFIFYKNTVMNRIFSKVFQSKFVKELVSKNIFRLNYAFDLKRPKSISDKRVLCTLTVASRFHFSGEHETLAGDGCSTTVHNDDYLDDIKSARKSTRLSGSCRSYIFHRVTQASCQNDLCDTVRGQVRYSSICNIAAFLPRKINEEVNVTETFIKISFFLTFNYNVDK